MEIKRADIKFFKKSGFTSMSADKSRTVKILPYLSVVQSVEGSYGIALGNSKMLQTGNCGFFIAPSGVQQTIVHNASKESGRMVCRWIFIDVVINGIYKLDSLYEFPMIPDSETRAALNALFNELFSTNDPFENYACCYKIISLIVKCAKQKEKTLSASVEAALEYMSENYAEQISVSDLASIAKMSDSNFYAVFKKQLGTSPISYLNNYRLSIASELLSETNESISTVCSRVGISDQLYFCKLFKKAFGMPPREYRNVFNNA